MSQIEKFNHACSLIFEQLYDAFPVPTDIDPVAIGFIASSDPSPELRDIFSATLMFLADEGYITFDRSCDRESTKQGARLTSKGLARLQKIPDGLQDARRPMVHHLKEALQSVGRNASSTAIAGATEQLLALVFSA